MSISQRPNKFSYSFLYDGKEYKLKSQPKGWDEYSIGLSRADDFGCNTEYTIPFYFQKDGRELLKKIYERDSLFSDVKLRIYRRDNDYNMNQFYQYVLDFGSYIDNINYISLTGKEDSLYSKYDTFCDTEYDIDLPSAGNKTYLTYNGLGRIKRNTIQVGYGDAAFTGIDENGKFTFGLLGTRAVQSYVKEIAFTNSEGLDYDFVKIRALSNCSFNLDCFFDIKLKSTNWGAIGGAYHKTSSLELRVFDREGGTWVRTIKSWGQYSCKRYNYVHYNQYKARYIANETISVSLNEGEIMQLILVLGTDGATQNVQASVYYAEGSYFNIGSVSGSNYVNSMIEVFPFSYLIEQLILKIDPDGILEYSDRISPYLNMLTCTDCIINIGKTEENSTGVIRCSLKKALESLDALECIFVDFTGNVMRIKPRDEAYLNNEIKVIKVNDIQIKSNTKHSFSKIEIGWESDDRITDPSDEMGLTYPFCDKKTFEVKGALEDNSLKIIPDFMGDCYTIEAYFDEVRSDIDNTTDKKIIALACNYDGVNEEQNLDIYTTPDVIKNAGHYYEIGEFEFNFISGIGSVFVSLQGTVTLGNSLPDDYGSFYFYCILSNGTMEKHLLLHYNGITGNSIRINTINTTVEYTVGTYDSGTEKIIPYEVENVENGKWKLYVMASWRIEPLLWNATIAGTITTSSQKRLMLYRGHDKPIINFKGDNATAFNIPYTPKRMIEKHLKYLSISGYKSGENITFVSSELGSDITSICDFEKTLLWFKFISFPTNYSVVATGSDFNKLRIGNKLRTFDDETIVDAKITNIDYENMILTFNYDVKNVNGGNYNTDDFSIRQTVAENDNIAPIEPLFLPATLKLKTNEILNSISDLMIDRYGFYKFFNEKTGHSYSGWINTITFAIGKEQAQEWELQAKNI